MSSVPWTAARDGRVGDTHMSRSDDGPVPRLHIHVISVLQSQSTRTSDRGGIRGGGQGQRLGRQLEIIVRPRDGRSRLRRPRHGSQLCTPAAMANGRWKQECTDVETVRARAISEPLLALLELTEQNKVTRDCRQTSRTESAALPVVITLDLCAHQQQTCRILRSVRVARWRTAGLETGRALSIVLATLNHDPPPSS